MGIRRSLSVTGLTVLFSCLIAVLASLPGSAQNDSAGPGFSLQVTPSPLVATIKRGEKSTQELRIRNTSTQTQRLKMDLRSFSVDEKSGKIELGSDKPSDVKDFITFSDPTFSIEAGQLFTQKVTIDTPASAGFTYSFAITIARADPIKPADGTAAIEGSVAVFTLLSVDRPGVERKFELSEFSSSKHVYEYLPANFSLKLKNTGNTLVQPKGNIYIQRGSGDKESLASIPLNSGGGYILPGTNRVLDTEWNQGFPRFETVDSSDHSASSKKLRWHWNDLSQLRIGKYTAKVVAVYDDGQRDVPVITEISFWVLPWKILLGLFIVILIVIVGMVTIIRRSLKVIKPKATPNEKA